MFQKLAPVTLVLLLCSTQAHAWIYSGNHKVSILVDRPEADLDAATVVLDRIRMHKCGGGYTDYEIDQSIDAASGWSTTVSGGSLCGISFDWDTDMLIDTQDWSATYSEYRTSQTLDGTETVWTALTPFTVTEGQFFGKAPRLYVSLDPVQ